MLKIFFSIRKSNIFPYTTNMRINHNSILHQIQKFDFARKSIYSNFNKNTTNNNKNETIQNNSTIDNVTTNTNAPEKIDMNSNFINESRRTIKPQLDKSLNRKNYISKQSLNLNKNLDLLDTIDEKTLKREQKNLNRLLTQFDSKEFDAVFHQKASEGMNEEEILNEMIYGKNSRKLKFSDLAKFNQIMEESSLGGKAKKSNGNETLYSDKNILDVEAVDDKDKTIYPANDLKKKIVQLKKSKEEKDKKNEMGPEKFEFIKLDIDAKGEIKVDNKLKSPYEIQDQAAKLNKIKSVDANDENLIDINKSYRKFVLRDGYANDFNDDIQVGFREDRKKVNASEEPDDENGFEKQFFQSFQKGPYKNNTNNDYKDQKIQDEEFEIDEENTSILKKVKKSKSKAINNDNATGDQEPVDFKKLRNLRKLKNQKQSPNNTSKDIDDEKRFASELSKIINDSNKIQSSSTNLISNSVGDSNKKALEMPNDYSLSLDNEDSKNSLKYLVEQDLNPFLKDHEKALQIEKDLTRLSRVSDKNIIDLKPAKDYYLKKKALNLAKLWNMDVYETKHWYRKLKTEEKKIVKALVQKKKFEQKKKLKKISKLWKIENADIVEINYLEKEREAEEKIANKEKSKDEDYGINDADETAKNDDVQIPAHYKNLSEFLFFGDDKDYLRHYKRTSRNMKDFFEKFFAENTQTVRKGIGLNYDISITEVKMNRACTIVYVWYNIPKLDMEISNQVKLDEEEHYKLELQKKEKENKSKYEETEMPENLLKQEKGKNEVVSLKKSEHLTNLENIYKKIELNVNKSVPYIKGKLTRDIGLKYAPDIRFIKDNFVEEYTAFEDSLKNMNPINLEDNWKKIIENLISKENISFLKCLYYMINEYRDSIFEYFDGIQSGEIEPDTLFGLGEKYGEISYENLLNFSDLFYLNNFNPIEYIYKLCCESSFSRDKIKKYIDNLKKQVNLNPEEFENLEKKIESKKNKYSLESLKNNKPLKNYLKKTKMTYEELKSLTNEVDKKEAINVFLNNFDYAMPGLKSNVISMSQMQKQAKVADQKDKKVEKKYENVSRKEYKKIKELHRGGKTKSQRFWDNLEKYYD